MTGLVSSEFRKIFTLNLWWALLIPITVLSFGAGWLGTAVGTIGDIEQQLGRPLPLGLLTVSMSTNFSTIFAALFGALAVSVEYRYKTITTTFLTARRRGSTLLAKVLAYIGMGLLYGLVNVLFATVGGLLGAGLDGFGNPVDWFIVGGAGLLSMTLWTLLGVGLGALTANPVTAILLLLAYKLVFEFMVSTLLLNSSYTSIDPYLPGAAGDGIVGNLAVPIFTSAASGDAAAVPRVIFDVLHYFFGGSYGHPWWLSLLTFTAYAAIFVGGGWWASHRRDIT